LWLLGIIKKCQILLPNILAKIFSKSWHWSRVEKCLKTLRPGIDVMIFKIFSPKNSAKKLAFFTQNKAKLCKILIITLVFEKKLQFFSPQIVETRRKLWS
jgi:hypothetical protein